MKRLFCLLLLMVSAVAGSCNAQGPSAVTNTAKFRNPLLSVGPDPWVMFRDGYYFFMCTTQSDLTIWKTKDITDLNHAEKKVVWRPPSSGPYSNDVWAPELHFLDGSWYIYFAADDGRNENHRIWVLQNDSSDPLLGTWTIRGEIATAHWAIDPTILELKGARYLLWSGTERDDLAQQHIFIARLKNPITLDGAPVRISTPEYPWEKVGDIGRAEASEIPHVDVNEGPEALVHGDNVFVFYSASGCWTDFYALGTLVASVSSNLLDPASWKKSPRPLLRQSAAASAYGTGHNGFFKSPDGREDWIIFHANPKAGQGCGESRAPRAQKFSWNADGSPYLGQPIPLNQDIVKPSGLR